nr:acyl-CoA dehydrogenase family protein [Sphingomonas jejuensis]
MPLTDIPAEAEAIRPKVRALIADAVAGRSLASRARSWQGFDADFSRALGKAGLIGLTLPPAYGGQGMGAFARFVVVEELLSAGAPVAAHWIADRQSAPLLLKFGTEDQRQAHIPAICRGERFFCIGMSEPGSGSDLASVRTRAEPQADGGWILNGAKLWTTNAQHAHYMIALVRTSGSVDDRHRGLSQLIIDLSSPGVSVRPIADIAGDEHFCEVHFEDVRLPADALVGAEGDGWRQVTAELALERSGPERIYSSLVLLDAWVERLRGVELGSAAIQALGRLVAELAVLRAMSISVTGLLEAGQSLVVEASLIKDLGTGFEQTVPQLLIELGDALPPERRDEDYWQALRYVTQMSPSFSLRGGTREILRGIIAKGIGLK